MQKNDVSTLNPLAPGTGTLYQMIWDFQPDVGGQMVFQCSNDPSFRVNGGIPIDPALALTLSINNEKYVEAYQIDVVNLPKVITAAHRALTAPYRTLLFPTAIRAFAGFACTARCGSIMSQRSTSKWVPRQST